MKERTSKTVVSFGFGIPGIVEFGFNYNDNKYSKSVKKLRSASGKVRCHVLGFFNACRSLYVTLNFSLCFQISTYPKCMLYS